jgi:hypothetical protein
VPGFAGWFVHRGAIVGRKGGNFGGIIIPYIRALISGQAPIMFVNTVCDATTRIWSTTPRATLNRGRST